MLSPIAFKYLELVASKAVGIVNTALALMRRYLKTISVRLADLAFRILPLFSLYTFSK